MSLAASVSLLLSECISFLFAAVPPRSRRTFVELLIGCKLNPEGWVTRASGKARSVRLRLSIAVARLLKGLPMRAAWCAMRQSDNTWPRPRLLLAETNLSAQAVVEIYAEGWGIEPLFHNLKRWWGMTNLWQHSKAALEMWLQIRCTAYALTQLLALRLRECFPLMDIVPWRKGAMITAGLFAQWLAFQFIGFHVREAYNPKPGHFCQDQRLRF